MALLGRVRAVHPQPVQRSRLQIRRVTVPDVAGDLGQVEAVDLARGIGGIVEANLDAVATLEKTAKLTPAPVERSALGKRLAGRDMSHVGR